MNAIDVIDVIDVIDRRQFYIDGSCVLPAVQHDALVTDPSTEQRGAVISLGSQADTNAVDAAATYPLDQINLVQHALHVIAHRVHTQVQLGGYLFVAASPWPQSAGTPA
jgi:hypothetical protein